MRTGRKKERKINLISSYGVQTKDFIVYARIAFTASSLILVISTLVFTLYLNYKKDSYTKETDSLELILVELTEENRIAKELSTERDEKNRILSEFKSDQELVQSMAILTKNDFSKVLDSLGRVQIVGVDFSKDSNQFVINCKTDTIDEPYYFAKRLKEKDVFADVSYGGFSVSMSNVVAFNITCVLREGEK